MISPPFATACPKGCPSLSLRLPLPLFLSSTLSAAYACGMPRHSCATSPEPSLATPLAAASTFARFANKLQIVSFQQSRCRCFYCCYCASPATPPPASSPPTLLSSNCLPQQFVSVDADIRKFSFAFL